MTLDQIIAIHKELRYEEALSAYEAYLDNNQDPHAKELYAIALAQSHHYEKALSIFKELYRQHPKRYSLLNHIALCHKHLGKLDLAQKHLKQSIKIQPYATTYNNLASIYLSQRDFIQAAILLQKALMLYPQYKDAWFNLGLANLELNATQEAVISFEHSASLGHKKALYQLGTLHENEQDFTAAKQYYLDAIKGHPTYAKAQHGLARAYLALGDDEKALEHFIEAQRIDPHIPFLMENIAKFFHAKGQYANAIEYWSKVPQQDDNIIEINYNIGVSYHFMGQHDSAKTYFENVLHLEPDHIDTHINLATIALQASNPEQALRHYKYIHAQDPSREDINYLLAALEQKHYTHNPPQDYVKNLFDQYAHYYEKHLTGMLRYQVPEEISLLLAQYAQKESITLDLGCGSGVMAQHLLPYSKHLTGVDLSPNMLAEATKKNLYHKLVEEDCITFIAKTTDSNLIVAADLLPYLADPAPLFSIIAKQTPPKSLFIFSFENSQKDSWHLSQHARFKHNPQEVITQLKSLGFKILEHHQTTLRYNQNKPVEGSIVSCVTSM